MESVYATMLVQNYAGSGIKRDNYLNKVNKVLLWLTRNLFAFFAQKCIGQHFN